MGTSQLMHATDIETVTRGMIPDEIVGYAREKVVDAARCSPDPVLHARITLYRSAGPAHTRAAHAKASLDVDGHTVRAHVAAATLHQAVDALHDRLRERLPWLKPGWRRTGEPTFRPGYDDRPPGQREIVRHKTYALHRLTADDAVYEMEALDYDFHLFTDTSAGQDAVVYRGGPTGYRLARLDRTDQPGPSTEVPLTLSPDPAARLTDREAVDHINRTGQPFLFFADAHTGRGRLLYHRYDGHYALITAAESAPECSDACDLAKTGRLGGTDSPFTA